MELYKAEDGKASFGRMQASVKTVEGVKGEVSYYARHANIEISLSGTEGIKQGAAVSAVIVTTDDGKQYGMRHVVNIWRGTEIGWNLSDGYDIDGKTITNIRYITTDGVIDYPVNIPVKKLVSAPSLKQKGKELYVEGLPKDFSNLKASLYYITGEGRSAQNTIVAENISIADGKILLQSGLTDNLTYYLNLTADNYAFAAGSFVFNEVEFEKASITKTRLRSKISKTSKSSITLSWNKISNADGYIVYGAEAGAKTLKQVADVNKTSYTKTKLKKGTYYRFRVEAYRVIGGEKVIVSETNEIYGTTAGSKKTYAKSIKLNKKNITLKKGKKFTLKAKVTKAYKKGNIKKYAAIRYESTNTEVAKVSTKGVITAVGKGSCTIYATTQEGAYTTVKITVK